MEEWQRFCDYPRNIDLLTPGIIQTISTHAILDVILCHNGSIRVFQMFKRLLELGVVFTIDHARRNRYFLYLDNCLDLLDLIGIKPCGDMYYEACRINIVGFMSNKLFLKVTDRCYFPNNGIELPLFACNFLKSKKWAQLGTFSTLHALKKMVGKDAARMIGRVVWSERKNYHLSRPNKK